MTLDQGDIFGIDLVLAAMACAIVGFGLFRMMWALSLHPQPLDPQARDRVYRLSDRRRRDRLGAVVALVCVAVTFATALLLVTLRSSEMEVRVFAGLVFLVTLMACYAWLITRRRYDKSVGLIIDREAVTVLLPEGEERLLKSQIAGLHLADGSAAALEGSDLPWLRQIGQVVLKSSDPAAADLKIPVGLTVDAAFDAWAGALPVLGSLLLEGRGDLTVRDVGSVSTAPSAWAQKGFAGFALVGALALVFLAQLVFDLVGAPDDKSALGASLLGFGGARADLVFEEGEWLRLISAAFLHRDPRHFIRCALMLALLAPRLERRIGSAQLLALCLISVLASAGASLRFGPADFVTVGASGAVFGLVGFWVGRYVRPQATRPSPWPALAALLIFTYIAVPGQSELATSGSSFFGPDYGGNLAGLIAGLLAAMMVAMIPRRAPRMVASSPAPGL